MTLSVSNLFFSYENRESVLEDISFSVEKGQFVGVFGPNGGGKTTLLKLILGLLKPDMGTIDVLQSSPKLVSDAMGYVPQMQRYDKQFPITVFDIALQGLLAKHRYGSFSKEAKEKAYAALEKVKMQDLAHRSFGSLSGGQMQRALLARALASNPKILLLDEATAGIDPETLHEIFDLLFTLQKEVTILLVTHDLQWLTKEMDFFLCINRKVTLYSPKEVCEHFAMGLYHPKIGKDDHA